MRKIKEKEKEEAKAATEYMFIIQSLIYS